MRSRKIGRPDSSSFTISPSNTASSAFKLKGDGRPESREQAYVEFITKTDEGRALYERGSR